MSRRTATINLYDWRDAERIYGALVSGNYFRALGATTSRRRLLDDADDRIGGPAVTVSYDLWQRRFAGSDVMGSTVTFNGHPVTVIGIVTPGFQGTTLLRSDAWVPLAGAPPVAPRLRKRMFTNRQAVWLDMGGRLKPPATLAQANAELDAIAASFRATTRPRTAAKGSPPCPPRSFPVSERWSADFSHCFSHFVHSCCSSPA